MTSRISALAARREALVSRSEAHRDEIRGYAAAIRGQIAWAETMLRAVQALRRSGPVIAGVIGIVTVVGPARVVRLLATASRYAPVALDAYRLARSGAARPPDEPSA